MIDMSVIMQTVKFSALFLFLAIGEPLLAQDSTLVPTSFLVDYFSKSEKEKHTIDTLQRRIQELGESKKAFETQLSAANLKIAALEKTKQKQELRNAQDSLEAKEAKITELKKDTTTLNAQAKAYINELNTLRPLTAKIENLNTQLKVQSDTINQLKHDVGVLEQRVNQKDTALRKLATLQQTLLKDLKAEIDALLKIPDFYGNESTVSDLKERINVLKSVGPSNELGQLDNKLSQFVDVIEDLKRAEMLLSQDFNKRNVDQLSTKLKNINPPLNNKAMDNKRLNLIRLLDGYSNIYQKTYDFLAYLDSLTNKNLIGDFIKDFRLKELKSDANQYKYINEKLESLEKNPKEKGERQLLRKIN
ncbi:MAG: coiled-coil domain-containing protein [Saprospiraceae bacterium]